MAEQQEEDTSSESDNEENLDATDPILVATNAGAHLSVPKSASISCKQNFISTKANTREKQETHVLPREHMRGTA